MVNILQVTLFRKVVPAFRELLILWKLFRKPLFFWKLLRKSAINVHWRKIYQWERKKAGTEIWWSFWNIILVSFWQKSKQNLIFIESFYSVTRGKKLKTHLCMYRKYWLNLICLKKIFILWPNPLTNSYSLWRACTWRWWSRPSSPPCTSPSGSTC